MTLTKSLFLALAASLMAVPAIAQDDATAAAPAPATASAVLTLTLESQGNIERNVVSYLCDDEAALRVQYVNAAPNFLAIVPVDGVNHIFATTISASGARYVSGPYEWWSHQGEATLRDLTQGEEGEPIATCSEASNTP